MQKPRVIRNPLCSGIRQYHDGALGHGQHGDGGGEYFVHEVEDMSYALKILLDKKYYDPRIINKCSVNESGLDFFDFYSDLYLFKEMYKFSMDNLQRRAMS